MELLNMLGLGNFCYIDPAATSILVTSISGIVIALATTAVIVWRRMRKSVSKALHIDENANKEVEDDVVLTDDAEETAEESEDAEETEEKEENQ